MPNFVGFLFCPNFLLVVFQAVRFICNINLIAINYSQPFDFTPVPRF